MTGQQAIEWNDQLGCFVDADNECVDRTLNQVVAANTEQFAMLWDTNLELVTEFVVAFLLNPLRMESHALKRDVQSA